MMALASGGSVVVSRLSDTSVQRQGRGHLHLIGDSTRRHPGILGKTARKWARPAHFQPTARPAVHRAHKQASPHRRMGKQTARGAAQIKRPAASRRKAKNQPPHPSARGLPLGSRHRAGATASRDDDSYSTHGIVGSCSHQIANQGPGKQGVNRRLTDGQQPVAPQSAAGMHHTKPMRNSRRTLPRPGGPLRRGHRGTRAPSLAAWQRGAR
jgi:hypothetical protein